MIEMFHCLSRYQSRAQNVCIQHGWINSWCLLQIARFQTKWRIDFFMINQRKKFGMTCIVNQDWYFTRREFFDYFRYGLFNFDSLANITFEPTLNSLQFGPYHTLKIWLGSITFLARILNRFLKLGSASFISRRERPITSSSLVSKSFLTIPSPIPLEAPVTTAIDPWNFSISSLESLVWLEHQS